jgi:hypothetical protein
VAGSLALLADAGHLVSDVLALGFAVVASTLAARPAQERWTYGYRRLEILSAQANCLMRPRGHLDRVGGEFAGWFPRSTPAAASSWLSLGTKAATGCVPIVCQTRRRRACSSRRWQCHLLDRRFGRSVLDPDPGGSIGCFPR